MQAALDAFLKGAESIASRITGSFKDLIAFNKVATAIVFGAGFVIGHIL